MPTAKFNCPAEMTLQLFSGKWKVIILWLLRKGPQRSGKLKSRLPGISSTAFSKAVRELESDALIFRTSTDEFPPQVSYGLSEKGESLKPIVRGLVKWGLLHRRDYSSAPFEMERFYQ